MLALEELNIQSLQNDNIVDMKYSQLEENDSDAQESIENVIKDWQENTIYIDEKYLTLINCFWQIISDFNDEQRVRFLQFTTGSARVPVCKVSRH